MKLREWTKALGQQHMALEGASETLCDMPMLGNNYAQALSEDEKKPCASCINELLHGEKVQVTASGACPGGTHADLPDDSRQSIYQSNGFEDREDYLQYLAEQYSQPYESVRQAAMLLGINEDFDGLVTTLQDDCSILR